MSLGAGAALLLLVLVGVMAAAAWRLLRWQEGARRRFAGPQAPRWQVAPHRARLLLMLAAAGVIVIAAARPQWGSRELTRERRGVDLVIALDVSQSMLATDAQPSRLQQAQDELSRIIEAERGNRLGLVFFAGSAMLRSPLTTDSQAVIALIRRAGQEGSLTRAGSDLGAALTEAARVFEGSESNGRAVLLVSDGEDHPANYRGKASELREKGIAVFTAGAGTTQGTTLTETDLRGQPRLKVDASGAPVITRLNEDSLRSIAADGGGRYVRLGTEGGLLGLRDDLAALQQTPLGEQTERIPIERFQVFAALALALLVAGWLLPAGLRLPRLSLRRLRPQPALSLLLLALLLGACGGGDSLRQKNEAANRLYDAGNYEASLQAYQELLTRRPDVPELSVNAGNALNRLGRFDRAVAETQRALPPTSAGLGAITFYDLGNHLAAQEQLEQAFDAYRNALLLNPSDEDAKHNLELTLLLLAEQQQQQQAGNQGGESQEGEQGEEEQQGEPQAQGQPQQQPSAQSDQQGQTSQQQLQRDLQEALRGIDEEVTYEEAVRILDLFRQQQQRSRSGQGSSTTGPDY